MARMLPREAENIGVGMNRSASGGQVYTALYKNIPILYDNAIHTKTHSTGYQVQAITFERSGLIFDVIKDNSPYSIKCYSLTKKEPGDAQSRRIHGSVYQLDKP